MFEKNAKFLLTEPKLLNTPERYSFFKDQEVVGDQLELNKVLQKIASNKEAEMQTNGDATYFDLEAEIRSHPNSLFVKCFAIKADEMNDNGDYFQYDELKKATPTFVGVPIFTNHNNTDAEAARGKVVHSWWDEDRNGIMIIARVDAEAYPQLARGIKEEYIVGTSMGCQVKYSLCSICHNKAETPDQYCSHIRERKTREISAKNQVCEYHKNGDLEECPVCKSKKSEKKKFDINKKAFEYNFGIKFIENSFVVNPACPSCGVTEIIDPQDFLAKVANIAASLPRLLKAASSVNVICDDKKCVKYAGQKEIQQLNDALNSITSVSQSMLQQKDQLDLEFLSDLVKVLSDLQGVTDELTQQGYGRLQSPTETSNGQTQESIKGPQPTHAVQPQTPQSPQGPIQSHPAGEVGTITTPTAAKTKQLNLLKASEKLIQKEKGLTLQAKFDSAKDNLLNLNKKIISNKKMSIPFKCNP